MATGGIFTIITNDGKQDRMLMATALLHEQIRAINTFEQALEGDFQAGTGRRFSNKHREEIFKQAQKGDFHSTMIHLYKINNIFSDIETGCITKYDEVLDE